MSLMGHSMKDWVKGWHSAPPQMPGVPPPAPGLTDQYVQQARRWQMLQMGSGQGSGNFLGSAQASQPISVANKTLLGS